MSPRITQVTGAVLAGLGVALGAFGAHAIESRVDERAISNWETAVLYHLVHAVGLIIVAQLAKAHANVRVFRWAAVAMLIGIFLFCGSLYGIVLGAPKGIAALAPAGGLSFMVAWVMVAAGSLRAP